MGTTLKEQGRLEEAIGAYYKALSITPDYADALRNMGIALKGLTFKKPNRDLHKIIISLLDKKSYIRPRDIAQTAISLLKLEPNLQKKLKSSVDGETEESALDIIKELDKLPLLLKLMSVCPLPDIHLESLLTTLRSRLLLSNPIIKASPELLRFQSALALQCFTNEYIYKKSLTEEKACKALEKEVEKTLRDGGQPSPEEIFLLASYNPLNLYGWSKLLAVTNDIKAVFTRQIEEPNQEEKYKGKIPVLKEIINKVSSKVKEQYEESPYPRWVNLGLKFESASIERITDEMRLRMYNKQIFQVKNPSILIAGCGTGQHSIETALRFNGSRVLAIDLSLSSLAYAQRKTEELEIENLNYMQADILDLAKLNRQFDIIESVGVLHHMDNPMAGWKSLTNSLKKGGLMNIGLYSELARQHIEKTILEITNNKVGVSNTEIKSFRNRLIKSDAGHHKLIVDSNDFYSLSELKDLIFHVQEHRFSISQIKDHLNELGLKFCGFGSRNIVDHFKLTNTHKDDPYNLNKWQAHEKANPKLFAGMYQFWCQKVD
jgi:2-polyprenyl-3-methyl-5-hydroxy-6-metoxy-1,4-benzoquinol methylase